METQRQSSSHQSGVEFVIFGSLLCRPSEKNVPSRGDIVQLCDRVYTRASVDQQGELPCCADVGRRASASMERISAVIGGRHCGRHLERMRPAA